MASDELKVFYSWQDTLPSSTNRYLILEALERAAKAVRADDAVTIDPVIDRDTQGTAGSPHILQTILTKIDKCGLFVADVSLAGTLENGKPTPNPNVLFELGYAVSAQYQDWQNIVLVVNTAYGEIDQLPFDLRSHRAMSYKLRENEDKAVVRKALQGAFEQFIRDALARHVTTVETAAPSLADRVVEAVNSNAPSAPIASRTYMVHLVSALDALNPTLDDSPGLSDRFTAALESTKPLVAEFARVSEAISLAGSRAAAMEIHRGFNMILERYKLPKRSSESFFRNQFDFYKFMGHELFATFVALLLDNQQWEILREVVATPFIAPNYDSAIHFGAISEWLETVDFMNKQLTPGWITLHGRLLEERHTSPPISEAVSFPLFVNADDFLFARGEIETESSDRHAVWTPWSSILLGSPPSFLQLSKSRLYAEKLATALGAPDIATMKQRLEERAVKISKQFLGHRFGVLGGFNTDVIATQ